MPELANLDPNIQKQIIDYCIQERTLTMNFEGVVYTLPNLIALTYYCSKCAQSYQVRIFSNTILHNDFRGQKKKCPECWTPNLKDKNEAIMYIAHKTVPINYNVFGKAEPKKGIFAFIEED